MTEEEMLARIGTLSSRGLRLVVAVATALEAGDVAEAARQVNAARPRSTVGEALLIGVALLSCTCDTHRAFVTAMRGDGHDVDLETYQAYLQRIGLAAARLEAGR